MANSKHDGHVTETPDVSYIQNVDVTHEASDVYVSGAVKFLGGFSVFTAATFLLTGGCFAVFQNQATKTPGPPRAQPEKNVLPQDPRLRARPVSPKIWRRPRPLRKKNPAAPSRP